MTRQEQPSYTPEMHVESNDPQRSPIIEVDGVASLKEYAAQHPIIVVAGVWIDNLPYVIEGHKLLKVAQKDKVKKVIKKIPIPFNEWFIYPPTPFHQVDEYLKEQLYSEPVLGSLALRTDERLFTQMVEDGSSVERAFYQVMQDKEPHFARLLRDYENNHDLRRRIRRQIKQNFVSYESKFSSSRVEPRKK